MDVHATVQNCMVVATTQCQAFAEVMNTLNPARTLKAALSAEHHTELGAHLCSACTFHDIFSGKILRRTPSEAARGGFLLHSTVRSMSYKRGTLAAQF